VSSVFISAQLRVPRALSVATEASLVSLVIKRQLLCSGSTDLHSNRRFLMELCELPEACHLLEGEIDALSRRPFETSGAVTLDWILEDKRNRHRDEHEQRAETARAYYDYLDMAFPHGLNGLGGCGYD
jgi:hypothetical protein